MATDYDAPRGAPIDAPGDGLVELPARRNDKHAPTVDVDETADVLDLPGADLLDEELSVAVVPMRGDEFRCSRCFLVHHRNRLARDTAAELMCVECG